MIRLDNILHPATAHAISAEFPHASWPWWHKYDGPDSVKYGSTDRIRFPRAIQTGLDQLADFIEMQIGESWGKCFIDREWYGGGMHMIPPSGYLGRHIDAMHHPMKNWHRCGSVVWFADDDWCTYDGGALLIGDDAIQPVFNSAVIFRSTSDSWHEVTRVYNRPRRTLAMFLWEQCDDVDELRTVGNTQALFKDD